MLWFVAVVLVLLGMAGVFLPLLPGVPLVFLGLLAGAWADGFVKVGWPTLVVLGLLTAGSLLVDLVASAAGARRAGASPRAAFGAALGTLVGLFFGLPGLIVGPFAGAVLGELSARRDLRQAGKAGAATWVGLLLGAIAKLALAVAMVAIFVTAYLV